MANNARRLQGPRKCIDYPYYPKHSSREMNGTGRGRGKLACPFPVDGLIAQGALKRTNVFTQHYINLNLKLAGIGKQVYLVNLVKIYVSSNLLRLF